MSVAEVSVGDLFIYRTVKSHINNPDNKWVNSYEMRVESAATETDLINLASTIVEFEQKFHSTFVSFDRSTISTWEPDSKPYNPDAFFSSTVTALGLRTTSDDLIGLGQCLSVARPCATGRFGHIFYRGVLVEPDVAAPAGKTVLSNKATIQALIDGAATDSTFEDNIGELGTAPIKMVLIDKTGVVVRPVIRLLVAGVSTLPQDHAWFNRTHTP